MRCGIGSSFLALTVYREKKADIPAMAHSYWNRLAADAPVIAFRASLFLCVFRSGYRPMMVLV
eukprot:4304274-Ditylum_brightwellii.AAC.1